MAAPLEFNVKAIVEELDKLFAFCKISLKRSGTRKSGLRFLHQIRSETGAKVSVAPGDDDWHNQHFGETYNRDFMTIVAVLLQLTKESVFLDAGSARGCLPIAASRMGVASAIGVEINHELHADGMRALVSARQNGWALNVTLLNDHMIHQDEDALRRVTAVLCANHAFRGDLTLKFCLYIVSYMHCVERLVVMKPLHFCGRETGVACDGTRRKCSGLCKVFLLDSTEQARTDWKDQPVTLMAYSVHPDRVDANLSRVLLAFQAGRAQPPEAPGRKHRTTASTSSLSWSALDTLVDSSSAAPGNGIEFTDLPSSMALCLARSGPRSFTVPMHLPGRGVFFTKQEHRSRYYEGNDLAALGAQFFGSPDDRRISEDTIETQDIMPFSGDAAMVAAAKSEMQKAWDDPKLRGMVPTNITAGPYQKKICPKTNRVIAGENFEAWVRKLPATQALVTSLLAMWKERFGYSIRLHSIYFCIKADKMGAFGAKHVDYKYLRRTCTICLCMGIFERPPMECNSPVKRRRSTQVVPACCRTPTYPTMRARAHTPPSRRHGRTDARTHARPLARTHPPHAPTPRTHPPAHALKLQDKRALADPTVTVEHKMPAEFSDAMPSPAAVAPSSAAEYSPMQPSRSPSLAPSSPSQSPTAAPTLATSMPPVDDADDFAQHARVHSGLQIPVVEAVAAADGRFGGSGQPVTSGHVERCDGQHVVYAACSYASNGPEVDHQAAFRPLLSTCVRVLFSRIRTLRCVCCGRCVCCVYVKEHAKLGCS